MNIAIISQQIYPCNIGGLEIFNYYFIKELASQGHEIWIFTCCDYDWNNEGIHRVKLWRGIPGLTILLIYFSIILNLIKMKGKIDLIHIPYTSNDILVFPVLLIKKLLDIPYVITIHGGGMLEWKLKILHQLFFKHADTIVAVSENIRKEYEKRSGRKIKVIPPLIPFKESSIPKNKLKKKYGFDYDDLIILFLGSIKRIKGCDFLLKAFFNLEKEFIIKNNLKLLYIGEGPMKETLYKIVEKNRFNKYVKFYGSVPHEKVPELYKLVHIYVIPSLYEGTPKSLLEAMFNGLPIVGSDTKGINNIILNNWNGLLFKVADEIELSSKLKKLIENKSLRNTLGKNAMKSIKEEYIYEKTVAEFIGIYKNILNEK